MCSTPRPRGKVTATSGSAGSILSTMSADARSRFAERANMAQDRRDKIAFEAKQFKQKLTLNKEAKQAPAKKLIKKHTLYYWLFNASLKEVFNLLAPSKRT